MFRSTIFFPPVLLLSFVAFSFLFVHSFPRDALVASFFRGTVPRRKKHSCTTLYYHSLGNRGHTTTISASRIKSEVIMRSGDLEGVRARQYKQAHSWNWRENREIGRDGLKGNDKDGERYELVKKRPQNRRPEGEGWKKVSEPRSAAYQSLCNAASSGWRCT